MPTSQDLVAEFGSYHTRCNLCGNPHLKDSYMYEFDSHGQTYFACARCSESVNVKREEAALAGYAEPEANESLWRYMSVDHFVDLLLRRQLHFTQLGFFSDKFEGRIGSKERENAWDEGMSAAYAEVLTMPRPDGTIPKFSDEEVSKLSTQYAMRHKEFHERNRSEIYVNCWHGAEHESVLMWSVYTGGLENGVSLRTDMKRLRQSTGLTRERSAGIAQVKYIDFRRKTASTNFSFIFKRLAFSSEREVRFFIRKHEDVGSFMKVDVSLEDLIDEVIFSPEMPSWRIENLKQIAELSGLKLRFRKSDLNDEPF